MPSIFNNKNRRGVKHDKNEIVSTDNTSPNANFDDQVKNLIPAEVRMISGCHSLETSADVSNIHHIDGQGNLPSPQGRAGGACTTALLSILYDSHKAANNDNSNKSITFQQILLKLREKLAQSGMSQIPQLTSSRPLELQETSFSLKSSASGGTQRALLVGINYYGQRGQLSGCINDVLNVKKYICEQHGFLEKHVLLLIDDGHHHKPTRENIIRALCRLVAHSKPGDSVYFHYSGHGGLLDPDYYNRFKAGKLNKTYDETLYPVDHVKAGQIRDFSLFNHFVKPMAAGVTVTCVMDCCHSGSVLDLPYAYQPTNDGTIRMRQSMDSLTNLAFLYILAGGILPDLFESVTENLQNTIGESIDNLQGIGAEELTSDLDGYMNTTAVEDTGGFIDDLEGTEYTDTNFGNDVAGTNYGDEMNNIGLNTGEETMYGTGTGIESAGDDFLGNNYDGDPGCGETDCDGCDVFGEVLGALLDDS